MGRVMEIDCDDADNLAPAGYLLLNKARKSLAQVMGNMAPLPLSRTAAQIVDALLVQDKTSPEGLIKAAALQDELKLWVKREGMFLQLPPEFAARGDVYWHQTVRSSSICPPTTTFGGSAIRATGTYATIFVEEKPFSIWLARKRKEFRPPGYLPREIGRPGHREAILLEARQRIAEGKIPKTKSHFAKEVVT